MIDNEERARRLLLNPTMAFIAVMALVVRLAAVPLTHDNGYYMSDERQYVHMAHRVLEGGGFVSDNGEFSTIAPLYIFLLAGVFTMFGPSLVVPHILGCLMGTIIVVLIALLTLRLFENERVAFLAAGVASVYPSFVIYSGLLVTETPFILLFLGSILLAYRLVEKTSAGLGLVLGVLSGLAALTRAVFLGFVPVLLLSVWWVRKKSTSTHNVIGDLVLGLVLCCLILAPWTIRNFEIHHAFVPVSTGSGKVLLTGNNPFAPQSWHANGFEDWISEEAAKRGVQSLASLSEVGLFSLYGKIALDYMVAHPAATLLLALQKAHIFWVYPVANTASNISVQLLVTGTDFLLYVGAAIGFVASWRYRDRMLFLLAGTIFFFGVQVVFHAEARFRLPLVAFFCTFAGYAATILTDRERRREFLGHQKWLVRSSIAVCAIAGVYLYTGVLFLTGKIS